MSLFLMAAFQASCNVHVDAYTTPHPMTSRVKEHKDNMIIVIIRRWYNHVQPSC